MSDKKILAIIPARGGSKGLPRKNIIDLNGKPLIAWSIEAALNSAYISTVVVSSEDEEILEVAKQWGAKPLRRPDALAEDTTASEPVILHALEEMQSRQNQGYDYLVLLQPTSPLRSSRHIDAAFEKLFNSDANALISVASYDNKVLKSFLEDGNGYLHGIANDQFPFMRRQDLPPVYMPNGAIYIIDVKAFLKDKKLFTSHTIPFEMDERSSVDVDTIDDVEIAKKYLNMDKA